MEENSKVRIRFSTDRIIRAGGAAGGKSWICVLGFLPGHGPGTEFVTEYNARKREGSCSHMAAQSLPSLWQMM